MNRIIHVITTDIDLIMKEEFNEWYQEEHLPRFLKVPGLLEARRGVSISNESPRYIAIYEHINEHVQESNQYKEAIETEWTKKIRPYLKSFRRQSFKKIFPLE